MMTDHTVSNAEGYTLGFSSLGVFRVIGGEGAVSDKLGGEHTNFERDGKLVRVAVGPGYADFTRAQCRKIQDIPGFGRVACIHRTEKPVEAANPFAGGWEAVATPFAKRIDAAIDRV